MPEIITTSSQKRYIHISPSALDDLEFCMRYYLWRQWRLPSRSDDLDQGQFIHLLLEHYYKGIISGLDVSAAVDHSVVTCRAWLINHPEFDMEIAERMITIFYEYCAYYEDDVWQPLAAEQPHTIKLFDNDKICVLFEFITDLIITLPGRKGVEIPVDHKSTGRFGAIATTTNQFLGTCFALQKSKMTFNRIGTQKNRPKEGRFHRYDMQFPESVLTEWRETTLAWIFRLLQAEESDMWPANHKACWNCVFKKVCEHPSYVRMSLIEQDFVKREGRDIYLGREVAEEVSNG